MVKKYISFNYIWLSVFAGMLQGCIENDLPYPKIQAVIEGIETDGFVSATINKNTATAHILVDDTIDLRDIRIVKMEITSEAVILPDTEACYDASLFPDSGFVHVDSLSGLINTRINLKKPANFTLRTYQDYPWEISASHYLNRKYNLREAFQVTDASGNTIQVGQPKVDEDNKNIIIYVDDNADLSNLLVKKMQIGSSIATTLPEPTTITDFRRPVTFEVSAFDETEVWTVSVTYALEAGITLSAWARRAYLLGEANENTNIEIRYRKQGEEFWDTVFSDEITIEDGNFTALIRHLMPGTTYEYEATVGSQVYDLTEFTTEEVIELPNSSFENWSQNGNIWYPFGSGDEPFWDSGNKGASVVNRNITTYDESIFYSGQRSAKLASENVLIRFAAGNLFIGEYIRNDGMDGILEFGKPFIARPTALKGMFRYIPTLITHTSDEYIEDAQAGMMDKGHIYVAVGDWSSPVEIRTNASNRKLFEVNDEHIIAYQEIVIDETVNQWTPFRLNLDYRSFTRVPTHIVIVCTASKYGDYFTGGDGSTMWLDDFELVYE